MTRAARGGAGVIGMLLVAGCGAAAPAVAPPAAPPPASIATRIQDHVASGRKLWVDSCSVPQVAGLCATVTAAPSLPCVAGEDPRLVIVSRDPTLAMRAIGELGQAVELWGSGDALRHTRGPTQAEVNAIDRELIESVASAYFLLAEPVVESVLARAPGYLATSDPAAEPAARLRGWVTAVGTATGELERHYQRLGNELEVDVADPWLAAAAARMALVHRYHAGTLLRAAIGGGATRAEAVHACETLAPIVAPLRAKAEALLARCRELGPAARATTGCEIP